MKLAKGTRVRLTRDVDALRKGAVGVVLDDYQDDFEGQVRVSWYGFGSGWDVGGQSSGWSVYVRLLEVVETWTPKVGDEVVITKSTRNWASGMDKFDGMRVVVTHVSFGARGLQIEFSGSDGWAFCLEDGHFKKAEACKAEPVIYVESHWIPKVGDEVVITKSTRNWNTSMDQFDGRRVVVTQVDYANGVGICIKFADCGGWNWCLEWGHFKKAEAPVAMKSSLDLPNTWTPKVGDEVVITKSDKNWNEAMDGFDGMRVVVTSVSFNVNHHRGTTIKFNGSEDWFWRLEDGHFKKAESATLASSSGDAVSDNDLYILTNSGTKLRVGDNVVITSGTKAWNSEMEKLVGKVVQISNIIPSELRSRPHSIKFNESGPWMWRYDYGHFVSCDEYLEPDYSNNKSEAGSEINLFHEKNKSVVTQKEIDKLTEITTFNF